MTRLASVLAIVVVGATLRAQQPPAQQAAGVTGNWMIPDTNWSIALKQDGATLTGKVLQGVQEFEIYEARIEGATVSFKAKVPSGERIITFVGTVSGEEIDFKRTFEVKEGGAPGGPALMGGPAGPSEFKARRTAPDTDVWSGMVRNAPNPNNPNVNPNPRPVTVGVRKMPDPHWRWRGVQDTNVRMLTLANQASPVDAFAMDGDQLTFEYLLGPQANKWACSLARQADGQFAGACRPETGNNPGLFMTLTPPKEGAKRP